MAKIRWSHEAEQWLKDIFEYTAQDNPSAAGKFVSGIYEKTQLLSDFLQHGHKYREEPEGDIRVNRSVPVFVMSLSGRGRWAKPR